MSSPGWRIDTPADSAGDADALRPFLLVASFVNPHDIVLFPAWIRQGMPIEPGPLDPPAVAPSPTDDEDLATKPAAQIAYRESYPTGYGPVALVGKSLPRPRPGVPRPLLPSARRCRRPD